MAVDWLKVESEYVSGNISYRKLAEKYSIPFPTLRDRAINDHWKEKRDKQRNKVISITEQKAAEKTAEALSDEAAAKARIKASMMRLAEGWFVAQEDCISKEEGMVVDPADFRRMVQSCVDLGILEEREQNGEGIVQVIIDV